MWGGSAGAFGAGRVAVGELESARLSAAGPMLTVGPPPAAAGAAAYHSHSKPLLTLRLAHSGLRPSPWAESLARDRDPPPPPPPPPL